MSLAVLVLLVGTITHQLHYNGVMIVAGIPLVKFISLTKVTLRILIID